MVDFEHHVDVIDIVFLVLKSNPHLPKKINKQLKIWLANNCNTHIAQYLTKQRQPDNKIWSVNSI